MQETLILPRFLTSFGPIQASRRTRLSWGLSLWPGAVVSFSSLRRICLFIYGEVSQLGTPLRMLSSFVEISIDLIAICH